MKLLNEVLTFLGIILLTFTVIGIGIVILWNNMLVPILHIPTIDIWQAFGIKILFNLLKYSPKFKVAKDENIT